MRKDLASKNPNQVARTLVSKKYVVSTICLSDEVKAIDSVLGTLGDCIDLSENPELEQRKENLKTPGSYESMVFHCTSDGKVSDWSELDFNRYSSEGEALLGHTAMVDKWSKEV